MSTFLHTYDLEGKKESVANKISVISPEETPFTSMTKKTGEHNQTFSWLCDELPQATLNEGVADGADLSLTSMVEPTKYSSFCQIFQKAIKVSGSADKAGLYGRVSPMAYHLMKASKVMKLDIEKTLLSSQKGQASNGSQVGLLDGFSTQRADAGGLKVARVKHVIKGAAKGVFNEEELKDLLDKLYMAGAKPSVIMFPAQYARAFSKLRGEQGTGMVNIFDGDSAAKINRQVTTYIDHYGNVMKCMPNVNMPDNLIYVFSPEYFEQHIYRNFKVEDKASSGDYKVKQLICEIGLANLNPDASGILNLTGAVLA